MDEVSNNVGSKITTDSEPKNGKKRARKELKHKEERERKRVKVEEDSSGKTVKISIKKVLKPKARREQAQSKATNSKENSTAFIEPKWNVVQPINTRTPPEATHFQEQPSLTKLKPRIWTSSREELVALLPELAGPKCLNGVSWLMYETPMVLLDESTVCFDISLQEDSVTLDLLTTREFTCTRPPGPEKVPDPPESLIVNSVPDGDRPSLRAMVTSSTKKPPKKRRTKSAQQPPQLQAAGSTNLTQTPPEGATLIDISIPLPTYTPHEPSAKGFKATGYEQSIIPSAPTYGQCKPAVGSAGEPYGTGTKGVTGPFGNVLMRRGRRTKPRQERPEGVLIDFSAPSVPTYTVHKSIAGGFSESPRNAHSDRGIANTATKHQHEHEASSNSIRPWDPTTKFRKQNHSANTLMSADPALQTCEVLNGCSNILIPTTVTGHQSQRHEIGQGELVKNQPPTFCSSSQSSSTDPYGLIEPLSHRSSPYEAKYAVTTDTNYTTPGAMDELLTKAVDTFSSEHSPSSDDVEPDIFESSAHTVAVAMDKTGRAQLSSANIGLNAGPAPQMQNACLTGRKLASLSAVPNDYIVVTNNQIDSHVNKPHSLVLSKPTDNQIPTSQTSPPEVPKALFSTGISDLASTGFKKRRLSQLGLKFKKKNCSKDQPTTHIGSKPKIGLQAIETVEATNCASDEAKGEHIRHVKALQDAFIPSTIPEEIQAIIDSYLSGRPVLLVISNKRFFDYWSLRLPEEFEFSMLGYFRILGVQESRVHLNDVVCPLQDSSGSMMTGRLKWCFRLQWSPGGEHWILPKHDKDLLEHPWWKPPLPLSIPPLKAQIPSLNIKSTRNLIINHTAPAISQKISADESFTPQSVVSNAESQSTGDKDETAPFEPESTFDTTPRYRAARLSNVNYKFRHAHLGELYHSHVPLQLLAPYGRTVLDSSFPRGWLCETCGKMNFQAALRHRVCSSSFCKGVKPEIAPYAIELILMRDPQDNLSMVLPYNEPLLINLVDTWEDGTRTLPYYIHDDENVFIKHIFTRNLPQLQLEATRLLHLIQIEVELVRPIGENNPYFQYSAHAPKDDPSPTTSKWPNVPLCIHHAKDWTQHQAMWFGELKKEQLSINHLCMLAWVTCGRKRGPTIIRAKEKCVVFHAFGCNITVMVTPLSSKATAPLKVDGVDLDSLIPIDDLPPDESEVNPGWIASLDGEDDAVEDPSQEDKEPLPVSNSKNASNSNRPFLFTLVHGDVLVFYGDDFEYSLKRAGTSLLLIASHQKEP